MAGRNQHFVPQLLQRGFSARITPRGMHQVWFYRPGAAPLLTGTRNLFAERDFYGVPSDLTLDRIITDDESRRFERVITELRSGANQYTCENDVIADFVHQISLRGRWIRRLFEAAGHKIISQAAYEFSDPSRAANQLARHLMENPGFLQKAISEELQRLHGRALSREELAGVSDLASMLQANPDHLLSQVDFGSVLASLDQLRSALDGHVAAGHLQGLERALVSSHTTYREFLRSMKWSVARETSSSFILGDCGPLHMNSEGALLGPVGVAGPDEVSVTLLPISSSQLLVGSLVETLHLPEVGAINESLASWSCDAFIARSDIPENYRLRDLIGSSIGPFLDSQVADAFASGGG